MVLLFFIYTKKETARASTKWQSRKKNNNNNVGAQITPMQASREVTFISELSVNEILAFSTGEIFTATKKTSDELRLAVKQKCT